MAVRAENRQFPWTVPMPDYLPGRNNIGLYLTFFKFRSFLFYLNLKITVKKITHY